MKPNDIHTYLVIAALFALAKNWKQSKLPKSGTGLIIVHSNSRVPCCCLKEELEEEEEREEEEEGEK